jgi:hypothetical protein
VGLAVAGMFVATHCVPDTYVTVLSPTPITQSTPSTSVSQP